MFSLFFFFFNDTATTEIYTLSLHDALPISLRCAEYASLCFHRATSAMCNSGDSPVERSEEHTSELQSHLNLVCRLLLEKKKNKQYPTTEIANTLPPQREVIVLMLWTRSTHR